MKLSTVIIAMLLAFLLFTPPGNTIGGLALGLALDAAMPKAPAPDPAMLAAGHAAGAAKQKAREACVRDYKANNPGLPDGYWPSPSPC